jgi:ribosome-associated protein
MPRRIGSGPWRTGRPDPGGGARSATSLARGGAPIDALETCQRAAAAALGKKAADVLILDVRKLVSYCDFFLLCSASNRRQAHTISDAVQAEVARAGGPVPLGVEGLGSARWILVDLGDVIVHVFDGELRAFYDLEGLWIDAPRLEVRDRPPVEETVSHP